MTLDKITAPVEVRKVVTYGSNRNKAINKSYKIQNIRGSYYICKIDSEDYGMVVDIILYYDGIDKGLRFIGVGNPEDYTEERIIEILDNEGVNTKEGFVEFLNRRMEAGEFIKESEMEFVKQWNSTKAEELTDYREKWSKRKHEAELKAQEERKREEAREKAEAEAKAEAELKAEKAKYFGWADNFTPMKFGKIQLTMEKLVRDENKIVTKRDFVISKIREGWKPEREDGVTSWYGSKWDKKESKPRTEYYLVKDNFSYKVSKTEFDFAEYLVKIGTANKPE